MDRDTISRQDIIQRLEYVIAHGVPNERGVHAITAEAMLEAVKQLPPAQPVIVPCDYAKACNEVSMNRITSGVVYMNILQDFKEYGYVLVDAREVTE